MANPLALHTWTLDTTPLPRNSSKNALAGMRDTTQSVCADTADERGRPSIAENSPKIAPAENSE